MGADLGVSSTNGSFTLKEIELHIKVLKLKTVYFDFQSFCSNSNVLTDNTTPVLSVNNMGSCTSLSYDSEVRKIWGRAIMRITAPITFQVSWILRQMLSQEVHIKDRTRNWMNLISIVFSITSKLILQLTYLLHG